MKQKLVIGLLLFVMVIVLIGLNAASYTQKEKQLDNEITPNRSTFNYGVTGTRAFFTLLSETGRKTVRWRQPPAAMITAGKSAPSVFVVTGDLRMPFSDPEIETLLRWVSGGGRLVVIDRHPPQQLATTTANWKISIDSALSPDLLTVDSSDQNQMTQSTAAIKPVQPTVYTRSVNAVQPSRFASTVRFERFIDPLPVNSKNDSPPPPPKAVPTPSNSNQSANSAPEIRLQRSGRIYEMPTPTPVDLLPLSGDTVESPSQIAPIVHFGTTDKNLVVDVPFGEGKIVFLSDPYVISNGGISLVDNAQLAVNLVATDGVIAFDEFHQGYGNDSNRFLQFFDGTPVVAIFLQLAAIVGLVFFSQSRRFGRPVAEPEPDRLSKLEYVSAMAELQGRTRAFDLAIENIYSEFRRRVARSIGLDNRTATSRDIAALLAERTGIDLAKLNSTLFECEEIVRGEPANARKTLRLAEELRFIEHKLGLARGERAGR